ncbi:LysR family transcriptional regulator [Halomonas elongata]|uniref:LysR family transcription regulator n=1 Tax=Halomonas elongata (strain ATCC 33173 / DSM 2581 / NBRC 15536 / NCIMB 2198 / 1H9) TaxID=768066 RepID=E1VAZ4_HALED|nr:LysR family transcriptional regulator [Halomonas elongata]MBW5801849.1 LysR family transcriptional regulator [Halomonas elongata]MDL4861742.1 LysR family transcriptional regulator [Halomonas elongata]RAW08115.1 LysR family transcriptional regulator [Halomonas elongata]WBF17859.1 LysR family transcriptional regulator [Halomonas elongata]WPU46704.1 LysR family transcriptional regulator [Halomonas elongata DSM 2581]
MSESMRHAALLNRLRYKHLLLIALLDEHRNLHQVARALNMSQPAATRMLREIEATFECRLFERTTRGVQPTRLGEVLIEFAHGALNRLDRCAESLHRHQLGDQGQLVLGAIMGAAPDLVAEAVIEMKRQRPLLQVRLLGETSDQLVELLAQNKIDIAIARYVTALQHNQFDFESLGNETMLAVVRRDHPLADEASLSLATLLEAWPWILQPLESPARQVLEKEFELAGLMSPRDIIECGSIFAALQLVKRSDGVLVMPESVLRDYLEIGLIKALPISVGKTLSPFGILTRKNEALSEPVRHLCAILRDIAGE